MFPEPELSAVGSSSDSVFLDQVWIRAAASASANLVPGGRARPNCGGSRDGYLVFEARSSGADLPASLEAAELWVLHGPDARRSTGCWDFKRDSLAQARLERFPSEWRTVDALLRVRASEGA